MCQVNSMDLSYLAKIMLLVSSALTLHACTVHVYIFSSTRFSATLMTSISFHVLILVGHKTIALWKCSQCVQCCSHLFTTSPPCIGCLSHWHSRQGMTTSAAISDVSVYFWLQPNKSSEVFELLINSLHMESNLAAKKVRIQLWCYMCVLLTLTHRCMLSMWASTSNCWVSFVSDTWR